MRSISGLLLMAGMVVAASVQGRAQTAAVPKMAGQVAGDHADGGSAVAAADTRSEKQKMLAIEADRLLTMATELKAQVDLTNKNILSLKVVQEAEALELYARRIKDEAKKHP